MSPKISIGFAAVALTLAAAAFQPASANYAPCVFAACADCRGNLEHELFCGLRGVIVSPVESAL